MAEIDPDALLAEPLRPQHPEPGVYVYEIPAGQILEAGRYMLVPQPGGTATVRKIEDA